MEDLVVGDQRHSSCTLDKLPCLNCISWHRRPRCIRHWPVLRQSSLLSSLRLKSSQDLLAKQSIAQQPMQCLVDCEAATGSTPVHSPPETELYVVNRRHLGKVHRVATHGPRVQHYLWHSTCHWYFARHQADYKLVSTIPENAQKCAKCFRASHQSSSSSDSNSSESSSANASG